MYKIIVTSKCSVNKVINVTITESGIGYYNSYTEDREELADEYDFKKLNGYTDETNFVDYIDNQTLASKLLEGYLRLVEKENELVAEVEYKANKRLSKEELEYLKNYTSGQLSDGIGEGMEQYPIYDVYYVSTWIGNNNITIKQTKL